MASGWRSNGVRLEICSGSRPRSSGRPCAARDGGRDPPPALATASDGRLGASVGVRELRRLAFGRPLILLPLTEYGPATGDEHADELEFEGDRND